MPFRFFALNRWQVTNFCNFPIEWPSLVRKPESERILWLKIYFCLKNVRREIPLKQFYEHVASKLTTARNKS